MEQEDLLEEARVAEREAERFREVQRRIKEAVQTVVVGQDAVVDGVLMALFGDGHALLEGVPGLAKTLLVRTLARVLDLRFSRIQFTPDLLPADVVGTMVLEDTEGGGHALRFREGPIVANFVLADEINRATPKTQSALLEAMQERTVSVGGRTTELPRPFVVLATQNPIEQEGTYPLPEAQLDRFLVKLLVDYPSEEEYHLILERTTGVDEAPPGPVATGEEVLALRRLVRSVPVTEAVRTHAIRLVLATQPGSPWADPDVGRFVSLGAGPRGAQGLVLCAKYRALGAGRFTPDVEDVRSVAHPVLRHRILLGFEGRMEGWTQDRVVDAALRAVPLPGAGT